MGCGEDLVRSNNSLWWFPWRRVGKFDSTERELVVHATPQPTIRLGDLAHTTGRPGLRAYVFDDTSPAVAARRSGIGIMFTQGPGSVRWVNGSASYTLTYQTPAVIASNFANDVVPSANNFAPGDDVQRRIAQATNFARILPVAGGPTPTVAFLRGDVDPAIISSGIVFTAQTGVNPWRDGFHLDMQRGEGLVLLGAADNTALQITAEIWEYQDWR